MPLRIIDTGKDYHISFEYDHFFTRNVAAVKAIPGRKWINGEKKFWWVPRFCKEQVEALVKTHRAELIQADAIKPEMVGDIAPLPELTIDIPLKAELRPYQRQGIARAIELKTVLIGDEQGLGKTLQSIGAVVGLNAFPCLVVCPSSTKLNWQREWHKFSHKKALVLDSGMNPQAKRNWHQYIKTGQVDVVIVNYESVGTFCIQSYPHEKSANGKKKPWKSSDVIWKDFMSMFRSGILDESQRCRNDGINQSKFILRIFSRLPIKILLSGTPVVNKPKDLYPQLAILGHLQAFGGKKGFLDRYCEGGSGSNNMKELNFLLNQRCFFRREKKDVARDLPDKSRQMIICDITTRSEYNHAKNDFITYLASLGKTNEEIQKSMAGEIMVRMGELKKISAKGKMNEVEEFVQEIMEAGEKLVLFCNLHEIVDRVCEMFPGAVTITGRDDMNRRQCNIDAFQSDPGCQLIVCNIKAGGVGITLTASSRVAFIEYPWTYADCVQCEDRCHRIGQKNSVMCTYFLGEDTIDEKLYELIQSKMYMANTITGASDTMQMELVEKAFNLFKK